MPFELKDPPRSEGRGKQPSVSQFRRQLKAMLDAVAVNDPEGLAQVVELLDWAAGEGLRDAVAKLREPSEAGMPGFSWADLAAPLGVSRQAAQQRFGKPEYTNHAYCMDCGERTQRSSGGGVGIQHKSDCPNLRSVVVVS